MTETIKLKQACMEGNFELIRVDIIIEIFNNIVVFFIYIFQSCFNCSNVLKQGGKKSKTCTTGN